jgi:hypothetical protein
MRRGWRTAQWITEMAPDMARTAVAWRQPCVSPTLILVNNLTALHGMFGR